MGDLRDWSPEPNGVVLEGRPLPLPTPTPTPSLSSSSSLFSLNLTEIGAEYWRKAEDATQGIIAHVQPTVVSEERRKGVIDYVQRLIRGCLGCEVFPFGSVPLKTYLPDGDIDLTAFGGLNVEEALANDVCSVLEREDQNGASEFVVKDVQLIRAEVKLVKCLVQNIVVDISFNQLGGLCTLCFLERVDRLIGKDHLFKRSIILIKAWCYYESRILGAHHGLISTYGLETLVLYIFHLFHSSLNGPLAVLYAFLDYFSKFDWENYCISLNGPARISLLPEIVAEKPENGGGNLLLSNDFLKDCIEMLSVPSRGFETSSRTFPQKHLNIVDPLKENNNLGRSVSKGNFYRIRSAFTYGARKLGHILSQPEENIADELRKFFSNTLDRHGSGQRPDVQDPIPVSGHNGFGLEPSYPDTESCQEDLTNYESECADSCGVSGERMEMRFSRSSNEPRRNSIRVVPSKMLSEADRSANGTAVSEYRISGDAEDLATSRIEGLVISNDAPKSSPPSGEESVSPSEKAPHAPHLYFVRSSVGNGEMRNGNLDRNRPENSGCIEKTLSSGRLQAPAEMTAFIVPGDQDDNQFVSKHDVPSPVGSEYRPSFLSSVACSSEEFYIHHQERASAGTAGSPEALTTLSDLSGDYESHLNSLHYGQWCYEFALSAPIPSISPPLPSQFQKKSSWDAVRHSVQFRQNVFPQMNANGVLPRPSFYPVNPPLIPGAAFGMEEIPKHRGTGTYFPNLNHYKDRPLTAKGRPQASVRSPRNSISAVTPPKTNLPERSNRDLALTQFPVHQGGGRSGLSDRHSGSPRRKSYPNANGSMLASEKVVEFGSIALSPSDASLLESNGQPSPGSPLAQNSSARLWTPGMQKPNPALGMDQDRVAVQSYRLKDEDDFPPLSG